MRLTTKGRFAVTAMLDVALRERGGPVSLASVSQRQQISVSYLEQLFSRLRQRGLVRSTRGPGGGYALGQPADKINLAASPAGRRRRLIERKLLRQWAGTPATRSTWAAPASRRTCLPGRARPCMVSAIDRSRAIWIRVIGAMWLSGNRPQ